MDTNSYLHAAYAALTLAMGVACLFSAESIDAARARARQRHAVVVPFSQRLESIVAYAAVTLAVGILVVLPWSAAALVANSGKAFVATMLVAGTIAAMAARAGARGMAFRSVAAAVRATAIFLMNLAIFYASIAAGWSA